MKKFLGLLMISASLLLAAPAFTHAQGSDQDPPPAPPTEIDWSLYFKTFGVTVVSTVSVAAMINKSLTTATAAVKQFVSWTTAFALGSLAHVFHLGIFAELNWLWTEITCVFITAAANKLYDTKVLEAILIALHLRFDKRE